MTAPLQNLIAALRDELQNYGELLSLLDRQQEQVFARNAENLLQSITEIQSQSALLEAARSHRDTCRATLAQSLLLPPDTPFGTLIPALPAPYQPLVQALVQENNELLVRLQQRARQNHLLLSRSVELMQRFLSSLLPGTDTLVYTGEGFQRPTPLPNRTLFEALG